MKSYYSKRQNIQQLSKKGEIVGEVEKWHAHKNGIPHKAISVALVFNNKYILQHRRHPLFDGVFDLTSSSHPIIKNGALQNLDEAVFETLKREWNIDKKDIIGNIKNAGEIYYKAKDAESGNIEHEYCQMYVAKIKSVPSLNLEYAYGFSLIEKRILKNKKSLIYKNLAPWSKKAIDEDLL